MPGKELRVSVAMRHILGGLSVTLLLCGPAALAKDLPRIMILATGGTIAGAQPDREEPGYKAGSFSVESLIKAVPQLKDLAQLKGDQVSNIGSQDMDDATWLKLARRVNQQLASADVDAVVITHGTDTMEETAYFLNLVVRSAKPVVLVGSMRPETAISADGPMNLYNAVAVAGLVEAKGRGVMVVMNDEIHYASEITKTNTTNPDTMKSPNRGRAGVCDTGEVTLFSPADVRHTLQSEFSLNDAVQVLPKVAIIYAHANMDRSLIDAAVAAGNRGIVVAGVGDGNMSQPAQNALVEKAKEGIVVVRSSRVGSGIVKRNVEVNDDRNGFVAARERNPQKARILLQLALTKTKDVTEIQRMFMQY